MRRISILKAINNIIEFRIFLAAIKDLNQIGNRESDLASSGEKENMQRKKGLNNQIIIRKKNENIILKYGAFILNTIGIRMSRAIPGK